MCVLGSIYPRIVSLSGLNSSLQLSARKSIGPLVYNISQLIVLHNYDRREFSLQQSQGVYRTRPRAFIYNLVDK
jgi:hypothetical protein